MAIISEYDCGCGIPADERLELLQKTPVKPTEWHQVISPKKPCRTCDGKQRHLFRREVEA
jgi:hypothetical protein